MGISLSPETQKLIEDRMRETGVSSADELIRFALETLEQTKAEDFEDLDPAVQAAIDEAESEYQQGGGIALDEAFSRLRQKYVGK